jgi:hypothetical protein
MSHDEIESRVSPTRSPMPVRKRYTTPRLERHGDVRTLTLGGSPGSGESQNPGTRKSRSLGPAGMPDWAVPEDMRNIESFDPLGGQIGGR